MDRGKALSDTSPLIALLRDRGLFAPGEPVAISRLTGGVSCDVWRVAGESRSFAVKRALPKLRVVTEWFAPVERAESEVAWLKHVARIAPGLVPEVVAEASCEHLFVMHFLDPETHPVWKDELIAGRVDPGFAGKVGAALAGIHAATANDEAVAASFQTDALFDALRIDPFLHYVADRDDELAPRLRAIAKALAARKIALVHGDISPKNILVGPGGPVILDAECAVYGDPAFDLAFCLTHLLLKAVWLREYRSEMLASARALADAYLAGVDWEEPRKLDTRAATLTAALLLARVEGKSPASYLTDPADRASIRAAARDMVGDAHLDIAQLIERAP